MGLWESIKDLGNMSLIHSRFYITTLQWYLEISQLSNAIFEFGISGGGKMPKIQCLLNQLIKERSCIQLQLGRLMEAL